MTISEVCARYDVTPDTLRYYERAGLIPHVTRTPGGKRDYTETDLNWIHFIRCMRSAGLSIQTLAHYVTLFKQGDQTLLARKRLLEIERDALSDRIRRDQAVLERLSEKIQAYETHCAEWERNHRQKCTANNEKNTDQ